MEDTAINKITKGAFIVFLAVIISKLLTYLYRILIARIGPEEYGIISIGFAVIGIVSIVSLFGLEDGLTRYISYYKAKKNTKILNYIYSLSAKITLALSIIFGIIIFHYAGYLSANIFHDQRTYFLLRVFAIIIPFYGIYKINLATLRGLQEIKLWSYIGNIGESMIKLVILLFVIFLGYELGGVIVGYALTILAISVISFVYVRKKLPKNSIKNHLYNKEILGYSWPLMFSNALVTLIVWIDTILLGYFLAPSDVGIYNAAVPTANLLSILPIALIVPFVPVLTGLLALKRKKEFEFNYNTITKWLFLLNLPIFAFLVLFSKDMLSILFGVAYAQGSSVLALVALGYLIYFSLDTSTKLLVILKRTRLVFVNTLIATILSIAINIMLIPRLGIIGAGIGTSSFFILINFLSLTESYKITKMFPIKLSYLKPIIAVSIISLVIKLIKDLYPVKHIMYLALYALIFFVAYFALVLLFKTLTKEELNIITNIESKIGLRLSIITKLVRRFV